MTQLADSHLDQVSLQLLHDGSPPPSPLQAHEASLQGSFARHAAVWCDGCQAVLLHQRSGHLRGARDQQAAEGTQHDAMQSGVVGDEVLDQFYISCGQSRNYGGVRGAGMR